MAIGKWIMPLGIGSKAFSRQVCSISVTYWAYLLAIMPSSIFTIIPFALAYYLVPSAFTSLTCSHVQLQDQCIDWFSIDFLRIYGAMVIHAQVYLYLSACHIFNGFWQLSDLSRGTIALSFPSSGKIPKGMPTMQQADSSLKTLPEDSWLLLVLMSKQTMTCRQSNA